MPEFYIMLKAFSPVLKTRMAYTYRGAPVPSINYRFTTQELSSVLFVLSTSFFQLLIICIEELPREYEKLIEYIHFPH
jgi:phosphoribosylamine-glycine ligase